MEADNYNRRRVIAKNSIFNLLGQVLPMLVGLLTIPLIVRGLGTDGYGILSIAYMVLGYFGIFDLGLSRATVKFVAENLSPDKVHKVPQLVWTSLALLVGLGVVGGALASIFVPISVTHWFKMPASFVGEARTSLFILCASMPVMLGNNALRGVLEAAQRFDLVNYVKVPSSVAFYLVAALVIPFGVHVPGIVALMVFVRVVSIFAYLLLCFHVFPGLRAHFSLSRASIRPLASFGGWVMISNITSPIFAYLERFMIATFLSVSALAFYSAPYELVGKMLIVPMSVVPSLFPYFSYHGSSRCSEVSEVTSRTMKYLLLALTPAAAIFIFFAKDILQIWLGPEFADHSTRVLQLTTLMIFINAFATIPYTSVQALGRPDLKAILDLCVLPVYAFISWQFMQHWGINGAALAKICVTVADVLFLYSFASKLKAFSFRDCISGPLCRAILASAGLLGLLLALQSFHPKLLLAIPLAMACFAVYLVAFWLTAIDERDRLVISGLRQRALAILRTRQTSPAPVQVSGNNARV
jgi:O-antigen/teichoic acid export membrane protein